LERKGRGKLGKGAGKLPGRQRRCCCCCAPNHPAAAVDATPLSRAKTSGMRVFHSSTPRADSRPGLVAGGRVQPFVAAAGAPRRRQGRRLLAGGRRIWAPRGGVGGRGGCVRRTARARGRGGYVRSGLGSRSREKETVQTRDWAAGPYRLGRDVSILKFPVHITWDTRTRRGYVSRPYPRCIRIGYVSDTGYGTAVTDPCF